LLLLSVEVISVELRPDTPAFLWRDPSTLSRSKTSKFKPLFTFKFENLSSSQCFSPTASRLSPLDESTVALRPRDHGPKTQQQAEKIAAA
jgi:hypothetical protein